MRVGRARTGVVALILLALALCSFVVPATAAPAAPLAQVTLARHTASATGSSGSTSVPAGASKKGVKLGPVVWALPAVAVLAAAVATPLALRRRRERAGRGEPTDHATDDR